MKIRQSKPTESTPMNNKNPLQAHGLTSGTARACAGLALASLLALTPPLSAQSTWSGISGNWSSNASPGWNGTGVPNAAGATAIVNASVDHKQITLDGTYTIGHLQMSFASANLQNDITFGTGKIIFDRGVPGLRATITVDNANKNRIATIGGNTVLDGIELKSDLEIKATGTGANTALFQGGFRLGHFNTGGSSGTQITGGKDIYFHEDSNRDLAIHNFRAAVAERNQIGTLHLQSNQGGRLVLGGTGATASTTVIRAYGNQTIGFTAGNDQTLNASIQLDGGNLTFDKVFTNAAENNFTIAGNIGNHSSDTGSRSVTIIPGNAGTGGLAGRFFALNGNNSYSGGTFFDGSNRIASDNLGSQLLHLGHANASGTGIVSLQSASLNAAGTSYAPTIALFTTNTTINGLVTPDSATGVAVNSFVASNGFASAVLTLNSGTSQTHEYKGHLGRLAVDNSLWTVNGATYAGDTGDVTRGSNSFRVVKSGEGTQILSGINTYTGATEVNGGILRLNGTHTGGGAYYVEINDGGTLQGTGSTASAIYVNSGGILSPGASVESLAGGALSFATDSTFEYEVDSSVAPGAGADLMVVNGNLSLTGTVTLRLDNLAAAPVSFADGTTFSLINYTGSRDSGVFTYASNPLANMDTFTFNGNLWQILYNETSGGSNFTADQVAGKFVNIVVIPEPGTLALIIALGSLLFFRRRK
jgi:autotransporter-associated beta strand protein